MLRHLQRVREPGSVKISFDDPENLRFVLQVFEILGVQDPVPIPLETRSVIIFFRAMERSADTPRALRGVTCQFLVFNILQPFSCFHLSTVPSRVKDLTQRRKGRQGGFS